MPLKRKDYIKVYVTKEEKENILMRKSWLQTHYPTLSLQDLYRLVFKNVDGALIEYLKLKPDDIIKMKLHNEAIFSRTYNKQVSNK